MGRGKLVFKGEEKAKKKKSSAKNKSGGVEFPAFGGGGDVNVAAGAAAGGIASARRPVADAAHAHDGGRGSASLHVSGQYEEKDDLPEKTQSQGPSINIGQGMLSTSSTVVSGHGTAFKTELRVGDAILAYTQKGAEEMRVITMVLSNISASISSAFSSDLKTPTPFKYINKPRDDKRDRAIKMAKARQEQEEVEQRAMGTYGDKGEIVYREKTEHGGYRIKREKATTEMTRSDLLSVREKKKSDRYC
ncbi:hypothetical protein ACHAW5_009560 [Stephanodiscus triporus]|uniref:Uncharacterized protein n=1 Tax=Stephanodiscus triporus TaxID=2934178 RepID=A0ABD3NGT0_9STRA